MSARDYTKEPTTASERDCATYGHCWHVRDEQHTIDGHRDDVCCWCLKSRCVTVPTRPAIKDGEPHRSHGHFGLGERIGWEEPPAPASFEQIAVAPRIVPFKAPIDPDFRRMIASGMFEGLTIREEPRA